MSIDPYKVLGISKTAPQDEIKKTYRSLVKKLHPDLHPGKKDIEDQFKEISTAYELIGTKDKRALFDAGETSQQQEEARRDHRYYQTQQEGGRYSQSFGSDFGSDIFENLFRGGAGPGSQSHRKMRGRDHLYKMDLSFRDAALGAQREITLPSGKKLLVTIPAAVVTGKKLRFKGQGGEGANNGPNGDAIIEISVTPLPGFNRRGDNVETELPISFQEGLLGAEIKIKTIDGEVVLNIPPGVSTGSRLRIRGKGAGMEGSRGVQLVALKVVLPTKVSPELKDAIKALDDKFNYNPRNEV